MNIVKWLFIIATIAAILAVGAVVFMYEALK